MGEADRDAVARGSLEQLAAENASLRRLVGELLLKNQRLRDDTLTERAIARGDGL